MSRTVANFIYGMINTITLPLSVRQKKRTVARVINLLEKESIKEVSTNQGSIKFFPYKSAFTASAIERFHTDEPETLEWINSFEEGDIFWDVGANIGIYSLYAGLSKNITVYAFEPSGLNFGLLVEHISINSMDKKIKPICIAFDSSTAIEDLYINYTGIGHASNTLAKTENKNIQKPKYIQSVPSFSIDDFREIFNLPSPNHLKIDVDGIEPNILIGAKKTLPKIDDILIEVEGRNLDNVVEMIEKPLVEAGLKEIVDFNQRGSRRNRLYSRPPKQAASKPE